MTLASGASPMFPIVVHQPASPSIWPVVQYFACSESGKGATSEAGKYLLRAANVWWRCAHVCFYVCCSDCVGVCGNVCRVAAVVKNSVF